jgi:hypothetical protein
MVDDKGAPFLIGGAFGSYVTGDRSLRARTLVPSCRHAQVKKLLRRRLERSFGPA